MSIDQKTPYATIETNFEPVDLEQWAERQSNTTTPRFKNFFKYTVTPFLRFQALRGVLTDVEFQMLKDPNTFYRTFYALADVSGFWLTERESEDFRRDNNYTEFELGQRPFDLSVGLRCMVDRGNSAVVEATPREIIEAHEYTAFSRDPVTVDILRAITKENTEPEPMPNALVMEIVGRVSDEIIEEINFVGQAIQPPSSCCRPPLAYALQSALQRSFADTRRGLPPRAMITNARLKGAPSNSNQQPITVHSAPNQKIALTRGFVKTAITEKVTRPTEAIQFARLFPE